MFNRSPMQRIELGLDNDTYRAAAGLSHSDSKRLRKSPFHFHALLQPTAPPSEPTAAMFAGTLAHCALLEPHAFDTRYRLLPTKPDGTEVSKSSNDYKAFKADCDDAGIEPITLQQRDVAHAQAAALMQLEDVQRAMVDGESEVSAWWTDPATEILCKCRPDRVAHRKGGVLLLDLKTTGDASPDAFSKSVATFGYHTQADWYSQGYALASGQDVIGFLFAVVESGYPYACTTYMLDEVALRIGRIENEAAREAYLRCTESNDWPSYASGAISLPPWYLRNFKEAA